MQTLIKEENMKSGRRMFLAVLAGILFVLVIGTTWGQSVAPPSTSPSGKPKILFVDSYHEGYPWSEGIIEGVRTAFNVRHYPDGKLDERNTGVVLRIIRMDTKRNDNEPFKQEAGRKVKEFIDSWKPDLVICADDNSVKYVILPYFRNTRLPFVFCGVNWDASVYGLPCSNVTGMLEISLIPNMLKTLQTCTKGDRLGLLGAENESNRKEVEAYQARLKLTFSEIDFVETFQDWKKAYLRLQGEVDILILAPPSFLMAGPDADTDKAEARSFVLEHTRIPTGSVEDWIAPYSLVCYAKRAQEQGEWAAQTALKILSGTSPQQIPVVENHQASVFLNMPLAKKLGILFPIDLIEQSTLVGGQMP